MSAAVQNEEVPATGPTATAAMFEMQAGQTFAVRHRLARQDLGEGMQLWRLVWVLGWLDIKLRYRGSVLGPFWLTLSTAVMVGALGFLYSNLFRTNLQTYLPFLALSMVLWGYVSTLVGDACMAFTQAEGMIRSIRMPFSLYAARVVVRNLMVLAHNVVVIVAVFVIFRIWPGATALLALPALLLWLLDSTAIALLLGAFCTRFRDVPPIVASVMQIAFFISPIIWRPELLKGKQWVLPYNPFYTLLEIVRGPLLGTVPSAATWISAGVFSVLMCGAAWVLFVRVRGRIAFWVQ